MNVRQLNEDGSNDLYPCCKNTRTNNTEAGNAIFGSWFLGSIRGEQTTTNKTVINGTNKFHADEDIDLEKCKDAIIDG